LINLAKITISILSYFIVNSLSLITNHNVVHQGDTTVSCDTNKFIKLDNEFHHFIVNFTSLVIISLTDQGKYLCLNKQNRPVSIDYILVAGIYISYDHCYRSCDHCHWAGYQPLSITYNHDNNPWQQVHPYSNVDCMATGGPGQVTIKWYHQNDIIPYYGRIRVEDITMANFTVLRLVLESAFPDIDSGLYKCVANNEWHDPVERSLVIDFGITGRSTCW